MLNMWTRLVSNSLPKTFFLDVTKCFIYKWLIPFLHLWVWMFRVYHVYCNFTLCYMFLITVIFGTLKDGSILINMFASNNRISFRNNFENGVDASSKLDDAFSAKSWKISFCSDFPIMINLCWFVSLTLITDLQFEFRTFDISICNGNNKQPIGTSTFYTEFFVQALSCFHCCC